jgi:hypothetical protein
MKRPAGSSYFAPASRAFEFVRRAGTRATFVAPTHVERGTGRCRTFASVWAELATS